jgi:hypothetical protein
MGHVQMWRDDLAEVVNILSQSGEHTVFGVTVDGAAYELDAIEDLATWSGKSLTKFEVNVDPHQNKTRGVARTTLTIQESGMHLRMEDPSLAALGAATQLERVARRCRRQLAMSKRGGPAWPVVSLFAIALTLVFLIGGATGTHTPHTERRLLLWAIWFLGIAFAVLSSIYLVGRLRSGSRLYGASRAEAPTFWQRKRDDITLHVVAGSVIGAVFFVLGILTSHFLHW